MRKECTRPNCTELVQARGLCPTHYAKYRRLAVSDGRWSPLHVPADDTRTRILALMAAGVGISRIAELAGVTHRAIDFLTQEDQRLVKRTTRAAVLAIPIPVCPFGPQMAAGARIDATGTRRRVLALAAIGWSQQHLSIRLGIDVGGLSKVATGSTKQVTVGRAREVDALYRQLQEVPGPSDVARRVAVRNGWPPPVAWCDDEIDDPNATPHTRDGAVVWIDLYRDYTDLGLTNHQIAERMGVTTESVEARLKRLRKKGVVAA
ncbi:Uncharacterised protein [Mycobacteroides abscessus subsp. abscessus]|uniref:winged helix-turn-helix domain-containing protein n=1 Tax=Mycobacteroides abscessus TaxID=36809 RepID=UPI0009CB6E6A|nr:winged helix-turn-helix domain-containing protein [Mycobacteroides abscessus]SLJ40984.1 Uncharacterised protein [Mycobacteroides abscessus subsp. abscessus]